MSLYILMKILELSPEGYDRLICRLFSGVLARAYDEIILQIQRGQRVLDIGCGTGALTIRASGRGALVKGVDINPWMLEAA
jgi:demethylmenaquinone methyltransferase/2-methoxy-6-polyprenyl-1,4-benzoquinol methylase